MGSKPTDPYLTPFYALFEGAEEVRLSFPASPDPGNPDRIGPRWDELGNLVRTEGDRWGSEVVAVVSLGEGRYRLAERCELFFSDYEFELERGDEFFATAIDAPMSIPRRGKCAYLGRSPEDPSKCSWGRVRGRYVERRPNLLLQRMLLPRAFKHYGWSLRGPLSHEHPLAELVHRYGGGWESFGGGLQMITVPVAAAGPFEEEARRIGWEV